MLILHARGVWRLPRNFPPEVFANTRGLPQGMASSVLFAELAISPLLWRLRWHDPTLQLWSYVDDLNVASDSMTKLTDALAYIREFEHDFHLSIANHKTTSWTNCPRDKQMLEEAVGFDVHERFSALGGDWMLTKSSKPDHSRETKRF